MCLLLEKVRILTHFIRLKGIFTGFELNFRFRFGASALKCRLCSVYLHQDCKIQFAMACVPKSQGTPGFKNGKQGYITDYVPAESPLLPPLIVHCVNEVCL